MKLKFLHAQSIFVIAACLITLPAVTQAAVNAQPIPDATHVTVRHEKGRCFGWPANGGIWSWGNEILVQYRGGEFQDKPIGSHDINYDQPITVEQSRSFDGGLTWTQHVTTPIRVTEPGMSGGKIPEFERPLKDVPALNMRLDFSHPNTILTFSWAGYLYYSTDRGIRWQGPFELPMFDLKTWQLRTDYLVEDRNTLLAFWSGSKVAFKRNENGGMVYLVKTADGGLTWTKEALASRITGPSETRHDVALMPATVRVSPTKLVCCIRNLTAYPKKAWIDCRVSTDNGRTWELASTPVGDEAGTTPPALTRLPAGRLVLTYGHRKPTTGPTSIRAKISGDDGATWGEERILRTGGGDEDIGYTRNALRPDGKIVTIYYWQESEKAERDIAATIWDATRAQPPAAEQAPYHVSAAGDDTNPGTESQPLATIPKAVDIAQPGDLGYVRSARGPFFLKRRVVVNNKAGEPVITSRPRREERTRQEIANGSKPCGTPS
jgi:hypothetical protein